MKKTSIAFLLLVTVMVVLISCPGPKKELAALPGWQVPVEVTDTPHPSQPDYYLLGWQSFIALNWPANHSYRGMPDTSKPIGATDAKGNLLNVVWETWKEQYDIFLPYGKNPGSWDSNYATSAEQAKVLRMFAKNDTSKVLDAFNEATGQPVIDQDGQFVRYEVRANQSEYTYYLNNSYYNADSQIVAVSQHRFHGFPKGNDPLSASMPFWAQYGATEVKASWRVFKPGTPDSVKNRYYNKHAILIDQYGKRSDTVQVGLVGLHILRLTPSTGSTWYWASFEQVDNLTLQPKYGGTLPAHPTFNTWPAKHYGDSGYSYTPAPVQYGKPLPPAIPVGISSPPFLGSNASLDSINGVYNNMLKGTPFQYYQLIGTINPPVEGQPSYTDNGANVPPVKLNAPQMANSTLETYIVKSNCVTCHIYGFPQLPNDSFQTASLQVFTFLPSMAKSSGNIPLRRIKISKLK